MWGYIVLTWAFLKMCGGLYEFGISSLIYKYVPHIILLFLNLGKPYLNGIKK